MIDKGAIVIQLKKIKGIELNLMNTKIYRNCYQTKKKNSWPKLWQGPFIHFLFK